MAKLLLFFLFGFLPIVFGVPAWTEKDCNPHTEIRCRNNRCVAREKLCDAVDDCRDAPVGSLPSDELHCNSSQQACLLPHQFFCKPGECIDMDLICDRTRDCGNGADEQECFVDLIQGWIRAYQKLPSWVVWILVAFVVVFFLIICCFCALCCCYSKMRREREF